MQLANVNVNFGANISGFSSGITSMQSLVRAFSGSSTALLAGVGVAIAGVAVVMGVQAVKAAGDFQQGLNRLITGAGDTTDNMKAMGAAILGISRGTGVLTDQLLPAMYQIISAGQRGAQAQDTLRVAAMGSIVEQAKIVDVAKAITTAMTDYVRMHLTATQAMNGYTRAVQLGKLTLEQLAVSMSPLLPIAVNLGIKFQDVAAAMATMTNAGLPAERAATSLRFLFQSLENPTKKAATAMKEWGLNSVKLANEMKVSLPGALQMVYDAAKKAGPEGSVPFNRAVSDMIGGQRSLQAFLSLTGSHMKTFKDDTHAIAQAMDKGKTSVLGWDVAQQNFNLILDKAKAAGQAFAIVLGTKLIPVILQIMDTAGKLVNTGAGLVNFFKTNQTASDALKAALVGLAVGAGLFLVTALPPLIAGFIAWAVAAGAAAVATFLAAAPFIALGLVVALAVFGIIEAIRHWAEITQWFSNLWQTVWYGISTFFRKLWDGIKLVALDGIGRILSVIALIPGPIGDMAKKALKSIDDMKAGIIADMNDLKIHVSSSADHMKQQFTQKMREMHDDVVGHSIIPDMVNSIIAWFAKLPGAAMNAVSSLAGRLASFFNGLAAQAFNWGLHIIQNLASGIIAGIGAAVAAAARVASAVASVLKHSKPEIGPLKDDDVWGAHLVDNFIRGILAGAPRVQAALASMFGGGSLNFGTSGSFGGVPAASLGGMAPVVHVHVHNASPDFYVDGRKLTEALGPHLAYSMRFQNNSRRPA